MKLHIRKRFMSLFGNPWKLVLENETKLNDLARRIRDAQENLDPLDGIVEFFSAVSDFQDTGLMEKLVAEFRKYDYGQHAEAISWLKMLNSHVGKAGRVPVGMNRTVKGQGVTANNVFLGDVYGLFTHTAAYWRSRKNDPKGGWGFPNMEHLNAYDVVSMQATNFMASHVRPMRTLVNCIVNTSHGVKGLKFVPDAC